MHRQRWRLLASWMTQLEWGGASRMWPPAHSSTPLYTSGSSAGRAGPRGQIGIGTLLLFIAVLLVATTTASVLVQTTGSLETQSDRVSSDVNHQTTTRVSVIATTGTVTTSGAAPAVETLRLIVKRPTTSEPIDLAGTTIHVAQPNQTSTLTYAGGPTPTAGATFGVDALRDPQQTVPRLTQPADRFAVVIASQPLPAATSVTITIVLPSGSTQIVSLTVPDSLAGETTVAL